MKKINMIICILIVVLLPFLGGCGQKTETTQDVQENIQEETTEDALVTAAEVAAMEKNEETTNPQTVDVAIRNYAFDEKTITIKAGDTVVWTNYDGALHTVTATDDTFNSGKMDKESVWSMAFDTPGTYTYYCTYHPNMKATVVVE